MENKIIFISADTHKKIKMLSAKEDVSMKKYLEMIINKIEKGE